MEGLYIAALDVGTTTVRCHILDQSAATIGTANDEVELCYPEVGYEEIEPEQLWKKITGVLRNAITNAGLSPHQITCLGISTQRSSFITWHRRTGVPFHNFITWKDIRADSLVRQWNDSFTMKCLRSGAKCLHMMSRNKRFLAGSVLRFMNAQVTLRLKWALLNVPELKNAAFKGEAMFGTVDTWLLYRLSNGKLHVTDVSNASATGFFDPFTMKWADWAFWLFDIPSDMLPEVWDTAADFGNVAEDIVGAPIPIRSLVADQSASMFGSCAFKEGDVKVTMGTGTFINVNTGRKPHASVAGLYPIVGWRIKDELVFVAEGASHDTGTLVKWAMHAGLLENPSESSDMAKAVKDSDGLFFIPAFSGLQAPVNNYSAAAGYIGIKPTTSRHHMVRALLESIVFRILQLYEALQKEAHYSYNCIRVDGGVSKNDFVAQLLADLTGIKVQRAKSAEMSVLGAAFLAGLQSGIWKSKDQLFSLRKIDMEFIPRKDIKDVYANVFEKWNEAVKRFLDWYDLQ